MDPNPPQIYPLRHKIEHWKVETKKDFITWEIRSLEHEIAKYICTLTDPVKEGDWDQTTRRITKLDKFNMQPLILDKYVQDNIRKQSDLPDLDTCVQTELNY